MSEGQAPLATAAQPAPELNSIQIVEQEIASFIRQREQAVATVHAVEGAIQAAQGLAAKLRAAAAKATAEARKLVATPVSAAAPEAPSEITAPSNVVSIDGK